MQHLLVSVSDSANLVAIQSLLLQTNGIERVESLDTHTEPHEDSDWKNNLHKPGAPLTAAQLEEMVNDMDNEADEGISIDELTAELNTKFKLKWGVSLTEL